MTLRRPAGRAEHRTVDRDGVVEVRDRQGDRAGKLLLGVVAALVIAGATVTVRGRFAPASKAATTAEAARGTHTARRSAQTSAPIPVTTAPLPNGPAAQPPASDEAAAPRDPDALQDHAVDGPAPAREGISVFPAPGTKRIKTGIVVPDDFPLPPGYVRHYQATDKGQMLPAILMFHPDHPPTGPDGNPITVPEDRIVPPDMVPAGLSIQMLEVPKDAYADREGEGAEAPR